MRQQLAAEFLGTFSLVFAGTGAIIVNDTAGSVTHVGIALVFGLVVLALIYALGDVSGAHFNPAVTIGFVAAGRFPLRDAGPYVGFQLAGALLASLMLWNLFPEHTTLGATLPRGSAMQSFWLELFLTWFLMFVILRVSSGAREKGIMAGVAVGAVIGLEALFAGPICGASMNPARSVGPAVVSGNTASLWIYLVAPILGALLAIPACNSVQPTATETKEKTVTKKRLLFVCVENSNRSQMAQAFARIHGGDGVEAFSAGSRPSGKINPKAIAAMSELGYDLSSHHSKSLNDLPAGEFDAVVTMGCGDACPNVPAKLRDDWQIPDPREMPPEQFREVRNLIESKVRELLAKTQ